LILIEEVEEMSIRIQLSVIISALVLVVSLALGVSAVIVSTKIVEDNTRGWMNNETDIGANLVSSYTQNNLDLLQDLANIARVQTMDPASYTVALYPYIESIRFKESL
jgi:hypothetical protein